MIDIDYVPLRTDQSLDVRAVELPGLAIGSNPLIVLASRICDTSLMFFPSSPPLFWALGFANAAAACTGWRRPSVPIVIHLLNRRKFREVPWAAMRFLLAAIRKNQRRMRIEQWLLLASGRWSSCWSSRRWPSRSWRAFGDVIAGQRTHRVLVLDGSLSMGYTIGRNEPVRPGQGRGRPARQGLAPGRRRQRDHDGRAAPSGHRRPLAQPDRGPEGDRRARPCPHGGTDLAATFEAVDRRPRRLDDPPEGSRLPDRPPEPRAGRPPADGDRRPERGSWPSSRPGGRARW